MSGIHSEVLRPSGSGAHGSVFIPGRAPCEIGAPVIGGSGGNEPSYIAELWPTAIPRDVGGPFQRDGEPLRLAALRVKTGHTLPDYCALNTALASDSTLATFDERLTAAARARHVKVGPPST